MSPGDRARYDDWLYEKTSRLKREDHTDRARARQKEELRETAQETLQFLRRELKHRGTEDDAYKSTLCTMGTTRRLVPLAIPRFRDSAEIQVYNADTLNVAIGLSQAAAKSGYDPEKHNTRPLIVNFANPNKPGGGWLNGQLAQEEAICYRSSLALSLNDKFYPMRKDEAIYSPYVIIVRDDMESGHEIYKYRLPPISAVTVAALREPEVTTYELQSTVGKRTIHEKDVFTHDQDRDLTKAKMRLTLRMAHNNDHRWLVLGALGCGVHKNPAEDIAHCWLEVLREDEFSGNRWAQIWFAVFDPKDEGNYDIFHKILNGQRV
ncbi:hypothetical protein V2G26_017864 [Clonostachys chloroleuca]|uniref:Microbial-type PARG catalytic domain-containing protein n=1 Tax=Clonostachys chloroleuca TaxID=1926264 RepID=A0AA35M9S2_9HYPO|nr:unnamed protein product [Clonostachys chloroleuca]